MDPYRDYRRTDGYQNDQQGNQSGQSQYSGHDNKGASKYLGNEYIQPSSSKKSKSTKRSQSQSQYDRAGSSYSRSRGYAPSESDYDTQAFSDTASTIRENSNMRTSETLQSMGSWAAGYDRHEQVRQYEDDPNIEANQADYYPRDQRSSPGQYDYPQSDSSNSRGSSNYTPSHSSQESGKKSRQYRPDTPLSSHYSRGRGH